MHKTSSFTVAKIAVSALLSIATALSLAACGSTSSAGASSDSATTLRVAYLSTANYLTTLKNDDFAQKELSPAHVKFTGPYVPQDSYTAVQSGNADAASTGTGYFIDLVSQKSPWVAFAIEYYSGNSQGIVAAPGSAVTSLKDLYGKKIAIDRKGATGDYIVHQAFANAGLDASKVTEVEMSATDFAAAFSSGKVDALASFDQNLAAAEATKGARILTTGDKYGSKNVSIHMVSKKFATEHPSLVKKLYKALVDESNKAQKQPSIITKAYKEFGASDTVISQVKHFSTPKILPIDATGLKMLEDQAQQYVDFGFITSVPDLKAATMDCSK
ncbi:MAG: NrtA/SsuA/CpmA family ABC transporter substrate-binding protein [Bifidobacteriaceae bacterium]|jgi:sulfonate transport system substrate-binding protein|nr:NrtA/SsuA/CpmA family ABC transporter substrate-binding protein [Bifidobacteriaceae bacterium]